MGPHLEARSDLAELIGRSRVQSGRPIGGSEPLYCMGPDSLQSEERRGQEAHVQEHKCAAARCALVLDRKRRAPLPHATRTRRCHAVCHGDMEFRRALMDSAQRGPPEEGEVRLHTPRTRPLKLVAGHYTTTSACGLRPACGTPLGVR